MERMTFQFLSTKTFYNKQSMPVRKFDFVATFFHKIIAEQIFRYKAQKDFFAVILNCFRKCISKTTSSGWQNRLKLNRTKTSSYWGFSRSIYFQQVFFKILRFAQNDVIIHKAGFCHQVKFLSTKVDPTSSKNLIMFINKFINWYF